jgi:hypothetical protein
VFWQHVGIFTSSEASEPVLLNVSTTLLEPPRQPLQSVSHQMTTGADVVPLTNECAHVAVAVIEGKVRRPQKE